MVALAKITSIQKGESLPFSFDRGGESLGGWTCVIEVRRYPGDAAIVARTITPADNKWSGFLTQTETAAFTSLGLHYLIARLSKTATDEEEQIPLRFHVQEAMA